jgi:hypothetical protein
MSTLEGYRIADEPLPSRLERFAVNPIWPLFAFMFGGALIGWAWTVLNGFALGSPTRRREAGVVAGGLLGIVVITLVIGYLAGTGVLPREKIPHALLVVVLWKLAISYWLFFMQSRTFELFQHFGGSVRNAFPIVVVAYFLRGALVAAAKGNVLVTVFL